MKNYNVHDWQDGEVITEALLDNIEDFLGYLSDNAVIYQGTLASKSDLNILEKKSIYHLLNNTYINSPFWSNPVQNIPTEGILIVINGEDIITQIMYVFENNFIYRRFKIKEDDWTDWVGDGDIFKHHLIEVIKKNKTFFPENLLYNNLKDIDEITFGKTGDQIILSFDKEAYNFFIKAATKNADSSIIMESTPIEALGLKEGSQLYIENYNDLENNYFEAALRVTIKRGTMPTIVIDVSNGIEKITIPEQAESIEVSVRLNRIQTTGGRTEYFNFNMWGMGIYKDSNVSNTILMKLIEDLSEKIENNKEKDLLDFIEVNTKMVNGIYASYYGEGNFDFSGNYNGATITENGNTYIYKKNITGIIPIEELGLKNGEQFALYYDAEWIERADVTDGEIEDIFETSGNIEIVLDFQDENDWGSRQIHTMANRMNIITVPPMVQTLAIYVLVSDEGYGPAEVEGQIWNLKLYTNIPNKIEKSSMVFFDKKITIEDVVITNGLVNINLNKILDFDDDVEYLASIDKNLIPLETVQGIVYNAEDLTISPVKIYGANHANAGKILYTGNILNLNNKEFYLLANYQVYNVIKDE